MLFLLGLLPVPSAGALEPDQLLLIVNRNEPESQKLAEFYTNARLIPAGRIVALDLPRAEEMSFEVYEHDVVPPVREFIKKNDLEKKVTCLVTFFGVPLRVAAHKLSPAEQKELRELQAKLVALTRQARATVIGVEDELAKTAPTYRPDKRDDLAGVAARWNAGLQQMAQAAGSIGEENQRKAAMDHLVDLSLKMMGPAGVLRTFAPANNSPLGDEHRRQFLGMAKQVDDAYAAVQNLQTRRVDPDARSRIRDLVEKNFGLLESAKLVEAHTDYLQSADTAAAVDNELALLWWDYYPRSKWQNNPLYFRSQPMHTPPVMMTMRLDAPTAPLVREMILASLKAERDGLKGQVVFDSRGITDNVRAMGTFGWFDESLRHAAAIVKSKTKLTVLLDEDSAVLPAGSCKDVAIYCGWYSLGNYIPACTFNTGAVGYHVASFELTSLHRGDERSWVPNLLKDHIAATLGPVAEPFLHAFPAADEFFPILMTGKLTLAETYWRTNLLTSWMITFIGDPLYNPYKVNPPMKVEALPEDLRPALKWPTTHPGR